MKQNTQFRHICNVKHVTRTKLNEWGETLHWITLHMRSEELELASFHNPVHRYDWRARDQNLCFSYSSVPTIPCQWNYILKAYNTRTLSLSLCLLVLFISRRSVVIYGKWNIDFGLKNHRNRFTRAWMHEKLICLCRARVGFTSSGRGGFTITKVAMKIVKVRPARRCQKSRFLLSPPPISIH